MPNSKQEFRWNGAEIEIEFGAIVEPAEQNVRTMLRLLVDKLHVAMPLKSFTCTRRPDNLYDYGFETKDGRAWAQLLAIPSGNPEIESSMTFDVSDFFKVGEFRPHNDLRLSVIKLIADNGMTSLKVAL